MKKQNVDAVYDDDLTDLLKNLGVLDRLRSGNMNCFFCDSAVTEKNLLAVIPYQGQVCVSCDRPECVTALNRHLGQ